MPRSTFLGGGEGIVRQPSKRDLGVSPLKTFLNLILAGRLIQETTLLASIVDRMQAGSSSSKEALILDWRVLRGAQLVSQPTQPKTATMTTTTTGGVGGTTTSSPYTTSVPLLPLAAVALLFVYQLLVSRPRSKGGSRGPPVVTSSPVVGIPVVGTILEFGCSPVKMVQRCHDEYGPVFTVPVRVESVVVPPRPPLSYYYLPRRPWRAG